MWAEVPNMRGRRVFTEILSCSGSLSHTVVAEGGWHRDWDWLGWRGVHMLANMLAKHNPKLILTHGIFLLSWGWDPPSITYPPEALKDQPGCPLWDFISALPWAPVSFPASLSPTTFPRSTSLANAHHRDCSWGTHPKHLLYYFQPTYGCLLPR